MSARTGRCLCGAVRYRAEPPWNWVAHCHCESCRRATSSPVTTFFAVPQARFAFIGEAPRAHASSPGVRRTFCGTCGSPIAFEHEDAPDEIHVYAVTLDDAADLTVEQHDYWSERLPWLHFADDLPRNR